MIQQLLTVSAGKRLIARALAADSSIKKALNSSTVVIIGGTTNGYLAEELLKIIGIKDDFPKRMFFRGITLSPAFKTTEQNKLHGATFSSDVIISKGEWVRGKSLFDVVQELKEGDVIFKGANAVNLRKREAAVLIGHPQGGTTVAALQAIVGRRVRSIIPVGVEKRVDDDIMDVAKRANFPGADGYRLLPLPGEIFTEIDALKFLSGVETRIMAAGGVCGAEGAVWFSCSGTESQEKRAQAILKEIEKEPPFTL
jgi:hypothetical protein